MTRRRFFSLLTFFLLVLLLLGGGIVVRNFFLDQVKKRIQATFNYDRLSLRLYPPALIIKDLRTASVSPFFSAEEVVIQMSSISLLTKEKPLTVFIRQPVLRIYETEPEGSRGGKAPSLLTLPFVIEKGWMTDGEFYYWGSGIHVQSKGLKAFFRQRKDQFVLQAEAEENAVILDSSRRQLEGKASLRIVGREKEINLQKVSMAGEDFAMKGRGKIINPAQPELRFDTFFSLQASSMAEFFDLPFDWEGRVEGRGALTHQEGKTGFAADLTSGDIVLNKVPMGLVRGRLLMGESGKGTVELDIQKRATGREYLRIDFAEDRIEGLARRVHLDPIMSYLSLPWPVKSPLWGNFVIRRGRLEASGEFQEEVLTAEAGRFPFRGKVRVDWDGEDDISFSSKDLHSSFAVVDVTGRVNLKGDVQVTIQGDVSDVKQARRFTSLILEEEFVFPEIRGRGRAEIKILGDFASPQVKGIFALSPGGFDAFDAESVQGLVEIAGKEVRGIFRVVDPSMNGTVHLVSRPEDLEVRIRLTGGDVEKILPGLDIHIPLDGRAEGEFEVREKEESLQVRGEFFSPALRLSGREMKDVKGKLIWENGRFAFPEIRMAWLGGEIKGHVHMGLTSRDFDVDIAGENLDFSALSDRAEGLLTFRLKGLGSLDGNTASGEFEIRDAHHAPFRKADARGKLKMGFSEESLDLEVTGNFFPGENDFSLFFRFPPDGKTYAAEMKGRFQNLDLLIPWDGAKGRVNYLAEIRGTQESSHVNGVVDFEGPLLPLPKFAHAFRDFSGLIFIQNGKVSLRSFQARLGGGDVLGSGELHLGGGDVENINLHLEGKNLLLSPFERTRALTDGHLRLLKDTGRFVLEGDFDIKKLSWRREIFEKFAFYSTPYPQARKEPDFFDNLDLNIRLRAEDDAWMENSLGRIKGRFDLSITGNVNAPIVMGDIEGLAGEVYFQDRKFKMLRGRLSFFNPLTVEPYLEFRGEAHVKDYRVTFSLTGLVDQLKPEFHSSPPLPPEDVLALLALGEAFKRTYSYDTSTQLSTASLLSFQIAEEAKKRAEKLFSLDRFRIDPFILGSSTEMTARLSVGKKISRNLFILYSTNLTTQREEIVRLEWELSDDFSIVGIRDEIGRISFDVKVRKRF